MPSALEYLDICCMYRLRVYFQAYNCPLPMVLIWGGKHSAVMAVCVWSGTNLNCLFSSLVLLRVCDSFALAAPHSENARGLPSQGLVEPCSDACLGAICAKKDAREREIRIKQLP